uniref:Uncharacterized protein n=1 Tax=Acrobeloides nanus TaxID=290746 RepID=A0A914E5B2_9BILA
MIAFYANIRIKIKIATELRSFCFLASFSVGLNYKKIEHQKRIRVDTDSTTKVLMDGTSCIYGELSPNTPNMDGHGLL